MRINIFLILVYFYVLTQQETLVNAGFGNSLPSSTSPTKKATSPPLISEIPSEHTLDNYEGLELFKKTQLYIVYKGILKTTGQRVLITKSIDVIHQRIPHEIKILKLLHTKAIELNWPQNHGLMHLIAHGMLKSTKGSVLRYPFYVTELPGDTVYDRYLKSKNKITAGCNRFSFRTTCMLGLALLDSLERLNEIGVAHGNLSMQNLKLKLKSPGDSPGDKINNLVLGNFASSRIYKNAGYLILGTKNPIRKLDAQQLRYTSADVIEGAPVTPSTDAWALFYIIMVSLGGNAPNGIGIDLGTPIGRALYLRRKRNPDLNFPEIDRRRSIQLTKELLAQVRTMALAVNYQILRNIFQNAMTESERAGDEFDWYPNFKR